MLLPSILRSASTGAPSLPKRTNGSDTCVSHVSRQGEPQGASRLVVEVMFVKPWRSVFGAASVPLLGPAKAPPAAPQTGARRAGGARPARAPSPGASRKGEDILRSVDDMDGDSQQNSWLDAVKSIQAVATRSTKIGQDQRQRIFSFHTGTASMPTTAFAEHTRTSAQGANTFQRVFLCSTFLLLGTFHAHSLQPKDGTEVMPPTFHAWRQEFPRPKSLRLAELPFGGARGLGCHSTPKKTSSAVNNIPGVMNRCFGPSIFGPSPGLNARRLTPAEAPRLARSPPPFPSSPAPPRARSRGLRDGRSRWRRERQRVIIIDRGKEGEG